MTQREVIEYYNKKINMFDFKSDDSGFSNRAILREIKTTLTLFKQRALKSHSLSINDFDEITLPCVALEKVDISQNFAKPNINYAIYKSKLAIPRYIKINRIADAYGFETFDKASTNNFEIVHNIRLNALKNKNAYYFQDMQDGTYLYLSDFNIQELKAVTINMIPEDYYEALIFSKCGEVNKDALCNPLDTPIGASKSIIMQVVDYLTKGIKEMPDVLNNDTPLK